MELDQRPGSPVIRDVRCEAHGLDTARLQALDRLPEIGFVDRRCDDHEPSPL